MPEHTTKNLLLTGPPACGKTTVVLHLVERLSDFRLAGFYTQELREGRSRVGFEAVGISSGLHAILAHARSKSRVRVGRYGVEPSALVPLVAAELGKSEGVNLFVIDEIGKMECMSAAFVDATRSVLESGRPLVATIAQRGPEFIDEVKQRRDVELWTVTEQTRAALPARVAAWVRDAIRT